MQTAQQPCAMKRQKATDEDRNVAKALLLLESGCLLPAHTDAKRAKIGSDPLDNTSRVPRQPEPVQQDDLLHSLLFYNPFTPPTQDQHMKSAATQAYQTYTAPQVSMKDAQIQTEGVVQCSIESAAMQTASTTHLEGKTGRKKRTSKYSHTCKVCGQEKLCCRFLGIGIQ